MRKSKYTKELLEPIAAGSRSVAQVLQKLGLKATGGNHRMICTRLRLNGVRIDHFKGCGWANGETKESDATVARVASRLRRPDEEVFVENSPETCGTRLVRRLIRLGWKYECQLCGLTGWRGQPLRLHLDHINGVNNDNRSENLRFLCPNCHSQTEMYCNGRRT